MITVLAAQRHPGHYLQLTLQAPVCASLACAGLRVRLSTVDGISAPLFILRTAGEHVELLHQVRDAALEVLTSCQAGTRIELLGPAGACFELDPQYPRLLLLGQDIGMAPIIMLANQIWRSRGPWQPLVLLESAAPFFFRPRPSRLLVPAMPAGVIANLPLLEDWGIPCRLATPLESPGCHEGYALELASAWLDTLVPEIRAQVMLCACVNSTSCREIFHLAQTYRLPYQVIKADDGFYEAGRF